MKRGYFVVLTLAAMLIILPLNYVFAQPVPELLKDINPGSPGSYVSNVTDVNGILFFTAIDGTHGNELWKTDGTEDGTVLVKDINPGSGDSSPSQLAVADGELFFRAYESINGINLWVSDGTAANTFMVKDIDAIPQDITAVNNAVFFYVERYVESLRRYVSELVQKPLTSFGNYCTRRDELIRFFYVKKSWKLIVAIPDLKSPLYCLFFLHFCKNICGSAGD